MWLGERHLNVLSTFGSDHASTGSSSFLPLLLRTSYCVNIDKLRFQNRFNSSYNVQPWLWITVNYLSPFNKQG